MTFTLNEFYADNGQFSHSQIIDTDTGIVLLSEDKEEQSSIDEKKRGALLQKVVERLNEKIQGNGIDCGMSENYRDLILETKLEE